jgi:PAS domain S-box-containing protein
MIASVKDYAILILDPEGRVATWNDGAAIIKGYETAEIVGQPFSVFFSPEDRTAGRPEALLERATKEGRVQDEGWRVRKNGQRFWAEGFTGAIRDDSGRLMGFSEVTRDLTERKLAEEKIRESQSRLAAILDGSPSVIFVKDPEGRYTLVNRGFEESLQMSREQVLGKTDRDLFDKETAQTLRDHDVKALEAGRAIKFEEAIHQKNRLHTYLSARVPLLGEDHQPYALCGVSTDITERKESEREIQRLNRTLQDRVIDHSVELMQAADELKIEREQRLGAEEREREVRDRLLEVVQNSPIPMWTYDQETLALIEVNSAAVSLHGSSRQELLQLRITDLYPQDEISKVAEEAQKNGVPQGPPRVWQHRAKDGQVIPLEILARRLEWEGRNAALVAGSHRDHRRPNEGNSVDAGA